MFAPELLSILITLILTYHRVVKKIVGRNGVDYYYSNDGLVGNLTAKNEAGSL